MHHIENAIGQVDQQTQACLNLWAAVLNDGVHIALRQGKLLETKWFNYTGNEVGGLPWICDLFGIDQDSARSMAKRTAEIEKHKNSKRTDWTPE